MARDLKFTTSKPLDQVDRVPGFVKSVPLKAVELAPAFAKNAALTAVTAAVFQRKSQEVRTEEAGRSSYLGTPVFAQVQIQPGSFFEIEDIEGTNPIDYEGIVMQSVLVDVSQSKKVVTTSIQGLDGEVMEFISNSNFVINISGNIIGQTEGDNVVGIGQVYPKVDTDRLIQICRVPNALTVTSEFLNQFGINEMVITSYKFAEKEGFRNMQPFQITALSSSAINLEEA